MANLSSPRPVPLYRCSCESSSRSHRRVGLLAATGLLLIIGGGCHDVSKFGVGTPCNDDQDCRSPLVCRNGGCALKAEGALTAVAGTAVSPSGTSGAAFTQGGRGTLETQPLGVGAAWSVSGTTAAQGASSSDASRGGSLATAASDGGAAGQLGDHGGTTTSSLPIGGAATGGGSESSLPSGGTAFGGTGSGGTSGAGFGGVWTAGTTHAGAAGEGSAAAGAASVTTPPRCQFDRDCQSTHCVDGFCCDSPCTEQCKACNLAGTEGRCTRVIKAQPVGARTPCKNPGTVCGGICSGADDQCSYPDSSTVCELSPRCLSPFTRLDGKACNGEGACASSIQSSCYPRFCNVNTDSKCGPATYTQVDVNAKHTCAIVSNGTVRCWGANDYGQSYLPAKKNYLVPTDLGFAYTAKSVAAGWGHSCTLLHDGEVLCWGSNFNGSLGCMESSLDYPQLCKAFPADSGVRSIEAGNEQTCALRDTGRIYCWGRGDQGQIGDGGSGDTGHRFTPTLVYGITNAASVAGGLWHTCAVLSDGAVKCWGRNDQGCLGNFGADAIYPKPVAVNGIDGTLGRAKAVDPSVASTCILMDDGSIRCAGSNSNGQLGAGGSSSSNCPVPVQAPTKFSALANGAFFVCGVVSPKSVKCWGRGDQGALGNGDFVDSPTPVDVLLPEGVEVASIVAKLHHVCIIDTKGRIWCWGDNDYGQLGNGTQDDSAVPVLVPSP